MQNLCCAVNAEQMTAGHLAWAPAKVILEKEVDRQVAPDVQEPKNGVHCIAKVYVVMAVLPAQAMAFMQTVIAALPGKL